jgi:hypothetical protein
MLKPEEQRPRGGGGRGVVRGIEARRSFFEAGAYFIFFDNTCMMPTSAHRIPISASAIAPRRPG